MTLWLKQRLGILVGASLLGGALVWNVGALGAQGAFRTESPKPPTNQKLTRDAAAKAFVLFLNTHNSDDDALTEWAGSSVIAAKTRRELSATGQVEEFMNELRAEWKRTTSKFRVLSAQGKTAIVMVENNTSQPVRPLVLIEENGAWGVDVLETYSKWNILQNTSREAALDRLIANSGTVADEYAQRSACQSNLKQIALGIAQYVQDYDEKYPLAKTWIDGAQPYVKSKEDFNCPSVPKRSSYGYAFNAKISSQYEPKLSDTPRIVFLYETTVLKRNAYGLGENLAFRHQNGANYAFADGHIKWFAKGKAPSFNLGKGVKPPVYNGAPPVMGMPPAAE